jgi:hypothetical protein
MTRVKEHFMEMVLLFDRWLQEGWLADIKSDFRVNRWEAREQIRPPVTFLDWRRAADRDHRKYDASSSPECGWRFDLFAVTAKAYTNSQEK